MKTITLEEFHEIITRDPYFKLSTLEKIETFKNNPIGWDFGGGVPAPQDVVDEAIKLHEFGVSLGLKTEAFPCTSGGICISFYHVGADECVEITTNPDLTYELRHEKGIGWEYDLLRAVDRIPLQDAKDYVETWVPLPPLKEGVVVEE